MARRFIDSSIFPREFRKLSPESKLTFYYIWTNCDAAGAWSIDEDLFEFENGIELDLATLKTSLPNMIDYNESIALLKDFILVDQKGNLRENYNPHRPIIKSMGQHLLGFDFTSRKMYFTETPANITQTSIEPVNTGNIDDCTETEVYPSKLNKAASPTNKAHISRTSVIAGTPNLEPSLNINNSNLNQASKNNIEGVGIGIGLGIGKGLGKGINDLSNNENGFLENLSREEELEIFGQKMSKEQNLVVDEIMKYFGFCEQNNFDKLRMCSQFVKIITFNKQLEEFSEQFAAYQIFKRESKQIVHGFTKFIGTIEVLYADGAWNAENWTAKASQFTVVSVSMQDQANQLKAGIGTY